MTVKESKGKGKGFSLLKVYLPTDKMHQLEDVAKEYGQEPENLASIWVIDRLPQLNTGKTLPLDRVQASPGLSPTTKTPEQIRRRLTEEYLSKPEYRNERCLFLQATEFKQWANHIAGFVLGNVKGKTKFTLKEIRQVLKEEIIPQYYDRKGFKESSLCTPDIRVNAPGDNPGGYPSLERINDKQHLYSFLGFEQAIRKRYGENDLKEKLSRCEEA